MKSYKKKKCIFDIGEIYIIYSNRTRCDDVDCFIYGRDYVLRRVYIINGPKKWRKTVGNIKRSVRDEWKCYGQMMMYGFLEHEDI